MTRLLVVGDALLDVDLEGHADRLAPDAPVPVVVHDEERARPGGAGLAAALAARDGADVTLVTALGDDDAGRRLRELLAAEGVEVHDLGRSGGTVSKTRVLAAGRPVVRIDHGVPGVPLAPSRSLPDGHDAVLVSDYGLGVPGLPAIRSRLEDEIRRGTPVLWDPHPRGEEPVPGCTLVTPNAAEAAGFAPPEAGADARSAVSAACASGEALVRRWGAEGVCVTIGAGGAVLIPDGATTALVAAPQRPASGDPCGAGDRFASRLALALADGRPVDVAVRTAVAAAAAFVAAGGARGASADRSSADAAARPSSDVRGHDAASRAIELVAHVRERGGTVVATGGCFDLLHAGHVETLQAARALGDLLVVCLNSDASVRRLKGAERPIVPAADRAAVLRGLGCVDEVVVFEEETPVALLERLRPDLFVKGGDYLADELPETPVLARWGGRVVTVPLMAGRSTTSILKEVRRVA